VRGRELSRQRVHAAWLSGPLAVALGVAAHVLAGERIPGLGVLLALTALLSMAASMIARLNVPVWMLLLVSGLVQQVLHVAFAGFSGLAGARSPEHGHGVFVPQPPQPSPSLGGHHALELMLDAHVAAALLTVLILTQSASIVAKLRSRRRRPALPASGRPAPPGH
jgi:hypothetical protein